MSIPAAALPTPLSDKPTSPPYPRTALIVGLVCANILVFALSGTFLYESRKHYERLAQTQTRNVSHALAQEISASIEKIDLTLSTVTDELEHQLAGKGVDERAMNAFLLRKAGRLPEIAALRVVNADGLLITGEQGGGPARVQWIEREFFAYHRDHADANLHFTKPFIGRFSKKYVITFTRRYNYPDGRFAGVAIAAVTVDHFTRLLSRFDLGPNGSLFLRDSDLGLITRYPPIPGKPAGLVGNSEVSGIGRQLSQALESEVSYHSAAGSDGLERIYTLRRLENVPMLVGASSASADYLAQWTREAYRTGAFALGFLLLSLATGGLLLRLFKEAENRQQILLENEERLHASQDNYRSILATSHDGFWQVDREGRLTDVNAAYCRQSGYSREELLGKRIADLEAIENEADSAEHNRRIAQAGSDQFESVHRRKDGSTWDVEVSASYSPSQGGRFFGFVRDISERKRAEAELKTSEEKFRRAFEVSPDAININRLEDGMYVSINRGFTRIMGYTEDEIIGRTSIELNVWDHPDDRAHLVEALKRDGAVANMEARFRAKDGSLHEVLRSAALIDIKGVPHIISVIHDITERKKAEAARARLEAQLRESQKMEALGTLAGGVAHDFNNIVAAILGNVELARQDAQPGHPVLESLEEIHKASLRAKALVQQILSFGRRQVIERKVISLAPVVEESLRLLRATLPAGVSLAAGCDANAPQVLADPTQIEQVLINLSTNAWQSIQGQERPGAIEVWLEAHEYAAGGARDEGVALVCGETPPGRYARLTVKDNGSGMAEDTLTRIFEPFFTTKPMGKGTGLGLAVVHGIMQEHGGSIEVRSVPGVGSTFRIYFPAARANSPVAPGVTRETAAPHGQGRHVLYVDDDESIVFLMTRLLERQGYRVSGYTDAHAALAAVRANPDAFDLAVTDYNMPGMSGLELARSLKQIRADLPIAMASGYINDELREEAPAAGISELIYKPNTVEELCDAVVRLAHTGAGGARTPHP